MAGAPVLQSGLEPSRAPGGVLREPSAPEVRFASVDQLVACGLKDCVEAYIDAVGRLSREVSELAGRTESNASDVAMILQNYGGGAFSFAALVSDL
jgi:hypothetical protein